MASHSSKFPVPIGYQFDPSKEQIFRFLRAAIMGKPLPASPLIETEIYGENRQPWNLFDKDENKSFWVLTKLKNKSRSRFDRKAGCGCWFGRGTKDVKDAHGQLLGFDKYFTFTCKNDESNQGNGHWMMHEYSLCDEGLNDYVICKITNKDAARSNHEENNVEPQNKKRKAPEVEDEESSSNPNQANADERNECRALTTNDQQNSRNLVCREIPDLNLVPTATSSNHQTLGQPDSTNSSLQHEFEELIRESKMKGKKLDVDYLLSLLDRIQLD